MVYPPRELREISVRSGRFADTLLIRMLVYGIAFDHLVLSDGVERLEAPKVFV